MEKAHPDVFNILLQILEDGRLTDNTGRTVSFKNTIIVMTSNAGAHDIGEGRAMGFGSKALADATNYNAMKDAVMKAVKDVFRPEFINRVDELIVFHPLTEVEIRAIAGMMLGQVASRLKERAIALTWDDEVVEKLAREGYDVKFGARPLRPADSAHGRGHAERGAAGRQNRAGRPRAAEGRRWKDYGGEGSIRIMRGVGRKSS